MKPNEHEELKAVYEGKYVDINYGNRHGASGWVKDVIEEKGIAYILFDYGYSFPVTDQAVIKEVIPPRDDKGMFEA